MYYSVVENTKTHTAYVAPSYVAEWADEILDTIPHKSEKAVRRFFRSQTPPINLVEKEARPKDLVG